MTLLLTEGFDWVETADLPAAYGAWGIEQPGGIATRTIQETGGRNGAKSFKVIPGAFGTDHNGHNLQAITFSPVITAGAVAFFGFAVKFVTVQESGNLTFFGISNGDPVTPTLKFNLNLVRNVSGNLVAGQATTQDNNIGIIFGTSSTVLAQGVWYYVEGKFQSHNTTGLVTIRINGVQEIAATGLDTLRANDNYSSFQFGAIIPFVTLPAIEFDDIYILDANGTINNDFLGDVQVQTLKPNGNGTTSQLVGTDADSIDNYLHVDDGAAPDDDTSYVESNTTGNKDTYAYTNLTAAASVKAVNVKTIAKKVDAGAFDIKAVARSGITELDSAALGFSVDYTMKPKIYETNPDTAVAWTPSEVDGAEFGVKVA